MKYFKIPQLLVFIIFVSFQLEAQEPWTLEKCIEYAHENNLQIKQVRLDAEIASNNYFQAKMQILPSLNGSLSRKYSFGHQVDSYTNDFIGSKTYSDEFGVASSMNLFAGLQTYNAIKANEFNVLSKMQNVEKEEVNITLQIANAYLTILFNQESLDVATKQKEVTQMQVQRTSKLVDAGSVAKGDLLEIKAQLASEGLNVTNAKNELSLAYLNLAQMLDLDSVGKFDIYSPDSVLPDFSVSIDPIETIFNDALFTLPHIKSAEYTLKYSESYLYMQVGKLSPTLTLNGGWGSGFSDGYKDMNGKLYSYRDQLDLLSSKYVSLTLGIPIFNKWQTITNISNAKVGVLQAETSLDQTKKELYKEIQQAHNDAISSKDRYESALEAVNSYREAFSYTQQKYNVGIVNSVDYNISKNNFIKSESELLQAKYAYIFAIKILDFYRGRSITL